VDGQVKPGHGKRRRLARAGEVESAGPSWHDARMFAPPDSPAGHLTLQFLAWIGEEPRSYGEVMDAWRTSCPRLSIWEDAVRDGLVEVAPAPPSLPSPDARRVSPTCAPESGSREHPRSAGEGKMRDATVMLTDRGRALLLNAPHAEARAEGEPRSTQHSL
jgi:hypothetical protein